MENRELTIPFRRIELMFQKQYSNGNFENLKEWEAVDKYIINLSFTNGNQEDIYISDYKTYNEVKTAIVNAVERQGS